MSQRVTAKRVAAQQNNIGCQHDCADADSKSIWKPKRFPDIDREHDQKEKCQIKKISMHILHNQRERAFTPVALARLTDGARRRIGPERFVICAAKVITREPKASGRPKN